MISAIDPALPVFGTKPYGKITRPCIIIKPTPNRLTPVCNGPFGVHFFACIELATIGLARLVDELEHQSGSYKGPYPRKSPAKYRNPIKIAHEKSADSLPSCAGSGTGQGRQPKVGEEREQDMLPPRAPSPWQDGEIRRQPFNCRMRRSYTGDLQQPNRRQETHHPLKIVRGGLGRVPARPAGLKHPCQLPRLPG